MIGEPSLLAAERRRRQTAERCSDDLRAVIRSMMSAIVERRVGDALRIGRLAVPAQPRETVLPEAAPKVPA
jgi:hypothetical protein